MRISVSYPWVSRRTLMHEKRALGSSVLWCSGSTFTLPALLQHRAGELGESHPLLAIQIEVGGIEPVCKRRLERRPLLIDHRVPGGITIATFVHGGLPEDALERKAVALRRRARPSVE